MVSDNFGNISFGETTKILVSIIGRDAMLSVLKDYNRVKFKKLLSRIYKEEKVNFFNFATVEKENPQYYFRLFFDELKKNYNVSENIYFILDDTIWQLFHSCLSFTPFEKRKTETVKYLFRRQVFHLLNDLTNQNLQLPLKMRRDDLVVFLSKISSSSNAFELILLDAAKNITGGNKSLLMGNTKVSTKQILSLQTIRRWDKGTLPTWKNIKLILDFFKNKKNNYVYNFLAVYFIKNAKKVFNDLELITNEEFEKIVTDVICMLIEPHVPEEFYDTTFGKEDSLEYHCLLEQCLVYINHPNFEKKIAEEHIYKLEQKCTNSKKFFSPWLKAKMELLANTENTNMILDYYRNAFDDGKYYAGCFTRQFLLEAILLENYYKKPNTEHSGNLNDYYDFGYSLEIFSLKDKDKSPEAKKGKNRYSETNLDILLQSLDGIRAFSLFNQIKILSDLCKILWDGPLLSFPYIAPKTEEILNEYLKSINGYK